MTAGTRAVKYALLTAAALLLVGAPVWLVLVNAAKPFAEARTPDFSLPEQWALADNFHTVLTEGRAGTGLLNSLLITGSSVAFILVAGSMAAWIFARSASRTVRAVFYAAIVGILVPAPVITSVYLDAQLGLQGSRLSLIGLYAGVYLSLAIFLITGFVRTIPRELEEAAHLDGAGRQRVFWTIVFPLLGPVLFAAGIVLWVYLWNDFFYAFFLLGGEDKQTLPLGLFAVVSSNSHSTNWNYVFADVIVVSLPLVLVFVLGQRRILAGVMAGGIKG
ncbi:carbohydrate ABC transporter permease [Streptomyces sp. NPDC051940]|uniref:carbohydrate ABC transporter permease n=1 Tax=Streptomyces sp. NPDC051940 TaxID=3155675 RepID=UPI003417BECF